MGESTEQLEWNIAAERRDLGRNLHALERKANALTDWRTFYRRHPLAVIGVAFGGSMVVGLLGRSRAFPSTSTDAAFDTETYRKPDTGFRAASSVSVAANRLQRELGNTWDQIADALLGVASAKAIELISHKIPGFGDEYAKRRTGAERRSL